ncbi:MAG: methyl-accepting chemotaxis protein, partial [Oscillospiraceae bacterium]
DMIRQKSQELLSTGTDSVVNQVNGWLSRAIVSIEMERDTLEQLATTPEGERAYVNHSATLYADLPTGIYFGTPDGRVVHPTFFPDSTYHVTEKGWYQDGLKSESFVISPVYVDAATGSNVVTLSSVLKNPDGSVRGVAATDIFLDAIAAIVAPVQFEQTGGMFLVDISTGTIIGHKNPELVGAVLAQQENPIYGYLAEQLAAKQTGEKIYTAADGIETWLDLAPVPGTDWAAVAYVPGSEVMSELNTLTQTLIAIAVAAILVLICIISLLVRFAVMRPMKEIDHVARQIADGKLNESIRFRSGDEFGALAVNFNQTVARLRDYVNYIDEISAVLHEIAHGKLSFQLQYEYVGEFAKVKDALVQISQSLNSTMRQINDSSD